MNDKLTTDNYQYRANQTHRDDVMRAAEQQRLAQSASGEPQKHGLWMVGLIRSVQHFFDRHLPSLGSSHKFGKTLRHTPSVIFVALFLSWALLGRAFVSRAQPIVDPGQPDPNGEMVHYGVGMYFQARGNQLQAIREFTTALEAFPQMGDAYDARGDSYVSLKQYALATADYTQALELKGDDPFTCTKRAFAFAALGDLDSAQRDFEQAISITWASPS